MKVLFRGFGACLVPSGSPWEDCLLLSPLMVPSGLLPLQVCKTPSFNFELCTGTGNPFVYQGWKQCLQRSVPLETGRTPFCILGALIYSSGRGSKPAPPQ